MSDDKATIGGWELLWRAALIAVQLVAAALMARQGELFFYQGF